MHLIAFDPYKEGNLGLNCIQKPTYNDYLKKLTQLMKNEKISDEEQK